MITLSNQDKCSINASFTPSISAAVARGDYQSVNALDKLGPLPTRAPNES